MESRVEQFEQIRRDRDREGLSIRGLAVRHGVHRRAVRQALASPVLPVKRSPAGRPAPKLGADRAVIDSWLEADRTAPRKQRHTAKRIHQRLVDERASFSGAAFCQASLVETQQAFLECHAQAFEWFGGLFPSLRFDNLKSAVKKVLKGRRRVESDRSRPADDPGGPASPPRSDCHIGPGRGPRPGTRTRPRAPPGTPAASRAGTARERRAGMAEPQLEHMHPDLLAVDRDDRLAPIDLGLGPARDAAARTPRRHRRAPAAARGHTG